MQQAPAVPSSPCFSPSLLLALLCCPEMLASLSFLPLVTIAIRLFFTFGHLASVLFQISFYSKFLSLYLSQSKPR